MPKVYLSETDKDLARLSENLRLVEGGRPAREMAAITGISTAAYCRRRQNPKSLSYEEIYRICREAGVDIRDFVGGKLKLKGE